VSGGRVVGVPRDRRILEGIRYGLVAELCAAAGVPFEERPVPRAELLDADEILLTAATREIVAVTTLDGRPVGGRTHAAGTPGPVFQRLRAGYDAQIDALRSAPAFVATVP
jgi:D-alanine transaminase